MGKKPLSLTFTGQAGFILETASGYRVGIDLYLSDCCARLVGFKRLLPYLYDPRALELDLLVATHVHYDHFDPDAAPQVMENPKTRLVCSRDVPPEARRLGIPAERITPLGEEEVFENQHLRITAVPCDHGPDTPYAIGLLIEADGKRLYFTGDTCYRGDRFTEERFKNLDVAVFPINGYYGNLNEEQGARAAGDMSPRLAIPCHYWCFAEHGGDPHKFQQEMAARYPDCPYLLMRLGETLDIN